MAYGMAVEQTGEVELYRFGRSKQIFRGPRPRLTKPYIAFIGGSEPFGKFVSVPFPKLVQREIGMTCANWGTPGAGPGFFLKDPVILEACSRARICVVQAMNPVALSNRMYSVFPRRNMRLRGISETLKTLYPNVDFDGFKYVSGMLRKLADTDPAAYRLVVGEQKSAWLARMLELMEAIETQKILLWMTPKDKSQGNCVLSPDMRETLRGHVSAVVEVPINVSCSRNLQLGGAFRETAWMTRSVHMQVATALKPALQQLLGDRVRGV